MLRTRPACLRAIKTTSPSAELPKQQCHIHAHDASQHCQTPTEVDRNGAHRHRRHEFAEELDRWVGHRIHHFGEHQPGAVWAPRPAEITNEVDDEARPQRQEEDQERVIKKVRDDRNDRHPSSMTDETCPLIPPRWRRLKPERRRMPLRRCPGRTHDRPRRRRAMVTARRPCS